MALPFFFKFSLVLPACPSYESNITRKMDVLLCGMTLTVGNQRILRETYRSTNFFTRPAQETTKVSAMKSQRRTA